MGGEGALTVEAVDHQQLAVSLRVLLVVLVPQRTPPQRERERDARACGSAADTHLVPIGRAGARVEAVGVLVVERERRPSLLVRGHELRHALDDRRKDGQPAQVLRLGDPGRAVPRVPLRGAALHLGVDVVLHELGVLRAHAAGHDQKAWPHAQVQPPPRPIAERRAAGDAAAMVGIMMEATRCRNDAGMEH